jgi:perosamine synthetase
MVFPLGKYDGFQRCPDDLTNIACAQARIKAPDPTGTGWSHGIRRMALIGMQPAVTLRLHDPWYSEDFEQGRYRMAEKLALHGGAKVRDHGFPSTGDISGRMIGEEEKKHVLEVLESGALNRNNGTKVNDFEKQFAEKYGVKHAIASTSGSASLHLAVAALDLEPGDEIITTTITDMGSLIGILMQNLIPMFADVDPRTGNITAETIEKVLSPKTKAIMPIHAFGQPCDMDPILALAEKHGLYVIEDACQAHRSEYKGKLGGTMGDIGCFSFQQSKQMTTGDGGMTVTDNDALALRMRLFSDKAWPRTGPDAARGHAFLGMNYRMPELSGAVGLGQLSKLDKMMDIRRKTAGLLSELIADIPGINLPHLYDGVNHAWWIYSFTVDEDVLKVTPQEFTQALGAEGIGFSVGYIPNAMFVYPVIESRRTYGTSEIPWSLPQARPGITYDVADYPGTDWFLNNIIKMSWNEGFTEDDSRDIATGIRKVAEWYTENPSK